jgi:hypothetical protein
MVLQPSHPAIDGSIHILRFVVDKGNLMLSMNTI